MTVNLHDQKWMGKFQKLVEYNIQHKSTQVPRYYMEDPQLGKWVSKQRCRYNKDVLNPNRLAKLNSIGFKWVADNNGAIKNRAKKRKATTTTTSAASTSAVVTGSSHKTRTKKVTWKKTKKIHSRIEIFSVLDDYEAQQQQQHPQAQAQLLAAAQQRHAQQQAVQQSVQQQQQHPQAQAQLLAAAQQRHAQQQAVQQSVQQQQQQFKAQAQLLAAAQQRHAQQQAVQQLVQQQQQQFKAQAQLLAAAQQRHAQQQAVQQSVQQQQQQFKAQAQLLAAAQQRHAQQQAVQQLVQQQQQQFNGTGGVNAYWKDVFSDTSKLIPNFGTIPTSITNCTANDSRFHRTSNSDGIAPFCIAPQKGSGANTTPMATTGRHVRSEVAPIVVDTNWGNLTESLSTSAAATTMRKKAPPPHSVVVGSPPTVATNATTTTATTITTTTTTVPPTTTTTVPPQVAASSLRNIHLIVPSSSSSANDKTSATCQKIQKRDDAWMGMFEKLAAYKNQHKSTQVPQRYRIDPTLGRWVKTQRYKNDDMPSNRIDLLNSIDFAWKVDGVTFGGPTGGGKKESGYWRGIRYDSLTEKQRKQAKAEVEAAPKAYEDMMKMFQEAAKTYKETGEFVGTDLCIFSTPNNKVTLEILLSSFYFSKKDQSDHPDDIITTFPRYNGTIILMGAAVRGSYKFYQESGVNLLPYHGATSGTGWSAVLIGMILADDCAKAYDKLIKEFVLNQARLIEILDAWDKGAPDSAEIKKFYEEHLKYQPLGIYRSDREKEGYVKIGLALNLIPQYKKLMKDKISDDYFKKNKVEVYAPELVSLMNLSMGSPRIHIYPAGTGAMGSHHDSSHNTYDDIRQQKYSILFDINDYKNK